MLARAIQEIRSLSKSLVTPVIKDIGVLPAVDELLDSYRLTQRFAIHSSYVNNLQCLSDDVQLTFYRILREQFTSIVNYTAPKNVG